MDAMLWELLDQGSPGDYVEVLIKMTGLNSLPLNGVQVIARIGNIASCRIRRGDIESIRAHDSVISMKAQRSYYPDPSVNDHHGSISDKEQQNGSGIKRTNIPVTGNGVIIGIADWGLDFTHPNFLLPDGTTRFKYIWNQDAAYDGVNEYGMGEIHTRDDINKALASEYPFRVLNYHPGKSDIYENGMHGTHVLDIAAGNGTVGPQGVAPEADIVAVHLGSDKRGDVVSLGNSITVFNALHFLDNAAGDQPLVVNMSVGSHGDAHAGLSLIEQAIDHLVTSKPNRAVVQSCGNYFTSRTHTEGNLSIDEQVVVEWLISEQDKTPNQIEIWYGSTDEILISLRSPDDVNVLREAGIGRFKIQTETGNEIGRYYHRKDEPNTKLNQILILLNDNSGGGKWKLTLHGKKIASGKFHSWIERDHGHSSNQSRFALNQSRSDMTTGSICNGFHTICVGAFDNNGQEKKIGFFSSVGPTWDGRQKPDLIAPGVGVLAAKSASAYENRSPGETTYKTGTSMATPFVTGAIVLLYEAAMKPLSIHEVRDSLQKACSMPAVLDEMERLRFGHGILNIEELIRDYKKKCSCSESREIKHQPQNDLQLQAIPLSETEMLRKETVVVHTEEVISGRTKKCQCSDSKDKKYLPMKNLDFHNAPIESLMETSHEQFPSLSDGYIESFYQSLPFVKKMEECDVQRGDILIRKQHGHHKRFWYGIVEFANGDEAHLVTPGGRKRISLSHDGIQFNWELKKLRPEYDQPPLNLRTSPIDQDFIQEPTYDDSAQDEEDLHYQDNDVSFFTDDAASLGTCGKINTGANPVTGGKYQAAYTDLTFKEVFWISSTFGPVPIQIDATDMRVYYPSDTVGLNQPFQKDLSNLPIVFLAHGNHTTFYDPTPGKRQEPGTGEDCDSKGGLLKKINNHWGYEYFQKTLAQLGIISASVDCNEYNCKNGENNINGRALTIAAAIKSMQKRSDDAKSIFYKKINVGATGLFGHSRGAEAVLLVPTILRLSGSQDVKVKGIISLAPTDNQKINTAPPESAFMVILPANDGDVRGNDGAKFYDRHVPLSFKTQLFIRDANHNNFNTEWVYQPDDELYDPDQPSGSWVPLHLDNKSEHQNMLNVYGCAFFRYGLQSEAQWFNILMGRESPPLINFSKINISAEKPKPHLLVDDFEDADAKQNALSGNNVFKNFFADQKFLNQSTKYSAKNSFFGDTKGIITQLTASSGNMRMDLKKVYNLAKREIWLRASEVLQSTSPLTPGEFSLGIEDKAGRTAFISVNQIGGIVRPFKRRDITEVKHTPSGVAISYTDNLSKTMLKTFVFPTECFQKENTKLDIKTIVALHVRNADQTPIVYDQIQIY